ncbi:MAG: hypothetical protein D6775_14050 [Caldilineae bacterium]|nr:MAG: hypothetical protein D6775_14050 [Caldilineae bacterium]
MIRAIEQARARRANSTGYEYGFVVVFEGEVSGWMNWLRSPEHWMPGALAIDAEGRVWEARGGDEYHGARRWERIRL